VEGEIGRIMVDEDCEGMGAAKELTFMIYGEKMECWTV